MFTKMKPQYLINTLKDLKSIKEKQEGVTVVITFSRKVLVPFFFKAFNQMVLPRKDMHLLVYDNTQDVPLANALKAEITPLIPLFKSVRLYKSNIKGRGCLCGVGNECFMLSKLYNIWSMWKRAWRMVYTDVFFQIEDDTIAPPNSFNKLYKTLLKHKKSAFVTGIEVGRATLPWAPTRLGVHKVKMKGKKILERHSFHPNTKGIKKIDAAGVYLFVARTKPFLTGFDGIHPYKDGIPFFAMDNVFTWNIKRHGYELYADFSVWCTHLSISTGRVIAWGKNQAYHASDIWIPKFHNYAMNIEIKPKGFRFREKRVRKPAPTWEI